MAKQALLLLNRNSRQGAAAADALIEALQSHSIQVFEDRLCKGETCSDVIARNAQRADLVIVAGGDGTLNSAVDGLVASRLPFGVLPLGTANDLARTLQLPTDLNEACRIIAEGYTRSIDVGCVNGKHFLNVASIGLSVEITRRLTKEIKRAWGVFAYLIVAFQAVYQTRLFHAEIRSDGETFRVKTVQIAVGNGRHYGGGLTVAEDAEIDDRRLDLYSLELTHFWQLATLFWRLKKGTLSGSKYARTLRGKSFEIVTRRPYRINTDGELTTHTPATFTIVPGALQVFVAAPQPEGGTAGEGSSVQAPPG
jgi:diacylglycerol kinase (ATP)